jgi:hypothetical protein
MVCNFPNRSLSFFRSSFSSILWIGELFDDIFAGGKAYSYRVPSDMTPEEVLEIHNLCFSDKLEKVELPATFTFSLFSEKNLVLEK